MGGEVVGAVGGCVAGDLGGEDAVDVDGRIFIVVEGEFDGVGGGKGVGEGEGAAEPDVGGFPLGGDERAGCAARAKARLPLGPRGTVEGRSFPARSGSGERVRPLGAFILTESTSVGNQPSLGWCGFIERDGGSADGIGIDFPCAAVVGEPAVDFDLDIGGLGVNGGGEAIGDETGNLVEKIEVASGKGGAIREGLVAPVVFGEPGVAIEGEAEAAEFAEHAGAGRFEGWAGGIGIGVDIEGVADVHVGPAAGVVDEARGIPGFDFVGDGARPVQVVLSPALIPRDPHDDGGVTGKIGNDFFGFGFEVGFPLIGEGWRFLVFSFIGIGKEGAGDILPDENAQAIAPRVVEFRFDLDVLAKHVAAVFLDGLEIKDHGFFIGRGVETIGPVALIEWTILEEGFAVEAEAVDT